MKALGRWVKVDVDYGSTPDFIYDLIFDISEENEYLGIELSRGRSPIIGYNFFDIQHYKIFLNDRPHQFVSDKEMHKLFPGLEKHYKKLVKLVFEGST